MMKFVSAPDSVCFYKHRIYYTVLSRLIIANIVTDLNLTIALIIDVQVCYFKAFQFILQQEYVTGLFQLKYLKMCTTLKVLLFFNQQQRFSDTFYYYNRK